MLDPNGWWTREDHRIQKVSEDGGEGEGGGRGGGGGNEREGRSTTVCP